MIVSTKDLEEYTYVFGEGVWKETVLLPRYYMEDHYEEVTEEQAYEVIKETDILYHKLETICENMLKKVNGLIPETQTKDLEIRIIYLLYCVSKLEKINTKKLKNKGFTNRMIETLKVLIENGTMENNQQMEEIRDDTLAMLVKSEDIYQNGQKNERDRIIIEERIEYEDMFKKTIG